MFFTTVGTVAAWVALVLGVLRIAFGVYVASTVLPPGSPLDRYFELESLGQAIDQGVVVVFVALALGTLTEVSRSVYRND
jgi:hypothetical protein